MKKLIFIPLALVLLASCAECYDCYGVFVDNDNNVRDLKVDFDCGKLNKVSENCENYMVEYANNRDWSFVESVTSLED